MTKMTTEEAFVKVLQMHGIEHAFGIIGSAMMPISDLFPEAGITFWDCAHEVNAGMIADGYTRATGKMSMAISQNGPGITNMVTPIITAYWNHTPMLVVTPQAANRTLGHGGFQEVKQMAMYEDCVCYQEELRDPTRVAEVLNRVIAKAWEGSAPAQMNIPRDMWTQVVDIEMPQILDIAHPPGDVGAIKDAAKLLSDAKFPVILNGVGVILSEGGIDSVKNLAERLDAPVCVNYQHNDAFPGSHPLYAGPLGYNGSKAAMQLVNKADVVLCIGNRLNPYSTMPGYQYDYWPKNAKIVQVDINRHRIGLVKRIEVGIQGDAAKVADQILANLSDTAGDTDRQARKDTIAQTKSAWAQELTSMESEADDDGITWNARARERDPDKMSPRQAWKAIMAAMPDDAWLLNIGRGPHVDNDALIAALDAGTIAGAVLDVTDPEPLPDGHALWRYDNVLITPGGQAGRTWPVPRTTYLKLVNCSTPTGPRACSLPVEIPISAPMPNSPPSANWVEALTSTIALSTSLMNFSAASASSVMMASVWSEPCVPMNPMASSMPSTSFTATMLSRYSVSQSSSVAGVTRASSARTSSSPRTSHPA